jgi:transposase
LAYNCYSVPVESANYVATLKRQAHCRCGFYCRLNAKNVSRDEVQDFLWYLLQHLRGHVIVIWDGARIHHRKGLATFCTHYPRLHLEKLPAYAPELNPIATVNSAARRVHA